MNNEQLEQIIKLLNEHGLELKNQPTIQNWKNGLVTTKNGDYKSNINNYKLWLENDSKYTDKLKYNEFFDYIEYDGKMIQDYEESFIQSEAEKYFNHSISRPNLHDAVITYVYEHKYNPVKEYLLSVKEKWDGKQRLETFIIDCLDADDNELNRFFTKKWMIAAVKRVFEPACQFDCVLALQGGVQGSGKTSLIRAISLEKYYKTFAKGEFKHKDSVDKMNKSWITLLDEFDKFDDNEVADLKSKITEKVMAARKSYAHNTAEYNVHWVYAATTNADDFLCDLTGDEFERRYWIIECKKSTVDGRVNEILNKDYVDQLWAEAMYYYNESPNQELYLSSKNPLFDEYKKFQMKFKKTSKRTEQDYIYEILNKKYSVDVKGCVKSSIDFYNQYMRDDIDLGAKYINRIPVSYVRFILQKVYNKDCSPKVIKSMMLQQGGEWEVKQSVYLGKSQPNILVRRIPKENKELDYSEEGYGLPF